MRCAVYASVCMLSHVCRAKIHIDSHQNVKWFEVDGFEDGGQSLARE